MKQIELEFIRAVLDGLVESGKIDLDLLIDSQIARELIEHELKCLKKNARSSVKTALPGGYAEPSVVRISESNRGPPN